MDHQQKGGYDEALKLYKQSLEIHKKLSDQGGVSYTLHQIANIHHGKGEYDEALKLYNLSLEIKEKLGDQSGIASTLGQIGKLHFARENYKDALKNFIIAASILKRLGLPDLQLALKLMRSVHEAVGEEKFKQLMEELQGEEISI